VLKRVFDPHRPHRAVIYLRMSSDMQNPRSPDQQRAEIMRRIQASGYKWKVVREYRDDAISGRYLLKRAGYQKMLRDIKSGALAVDLILVDMIERFGRVEELPAIRKELSERFGVLILTADAGLADPTTPQGKALQMFEAMRATEHGRILAHNVLRGKRDAAEQKHWPGGPPPFGYKLKSVMTVIKGREEVDFHVLVPDAETRWIIELMFKVAEENSWGALRIAKYLNQQSDIPEVFKPFSFHTIGCRLDNEIYCGDLAYEKYCVGIVDDTRVIERNAPEDVLRVPDFCEPLIPRQRWKYVQAMRQVRRELIAKSRSSERKGEEKQIAPLTQGLSLNYLLSGLLVCGCCGRRMIASSSAAYTAKDGQTRRYTSYACPAYLNGHCVNGKRVPEEWIRQVVVERLRERLFPSR
jgi:DNA invertase Pin-like site-specific DNA recombinase